MTSKVSNRLEKHKIFKQNDSNCFKKGLKEEMLKFNSDCLIQNASNS
jgi:hypothetical protein